MSPISAILYVDEKGKEHKKSQCKVTKHCHCENWQTCPHPWELADDGAGTIVKSNGKMIWGHKASVLGLPRQGIPLDAVAIADGATFDGETFFLMLKCFLNTFRSLDPGLIRRCMIAPVITGL